MLAMTMDLRTICAESQVGRQVRQLILDLFVQSALKSMPLQRKVKGRKNYCGECLREIKGRYPDIVHSEDSTPMCKARPVRTQFGNPIEFEVDTVTRDRIAASGLDPRCHEYWEVHAAADGNKGWRSWKGKPEVGPQKQYQPQQDSFWCGNCGGYRKWTHVCSLAK